MRNLQRLVGLAFLVTGCSSGALPPGAGDGSGGPSDASVPLSTADVVCGAITCAAPSGVCCRAQPFGDGTCVAPGAPCATNTWACDNTSDCPSGSVCCQLANGSACVAASACTGPQMCLVDGDCPSGQTCCGVGDTANFHCSTGACPISRRAYKADVAYLDAQGAQQLHDQLLEYRLGTYRYRADASGARHLGFLIDDVGRAPSVTADGEHVDLYGYTSMAVATLQVQEREIASLREEVASLRREMARIRAKGR